MKDQIMMNTLALIILLFFTIVNAEVAAGSGVRAHMHMHVRGSGSEEKAEKLETAGVAEESFCQDVAMDIIGTIWNLTDFRWGSFEEGEEEPLQPVNLTHERRGMILKLGENTTSGSCGSNLCWGVVEYFQEETLNIIWIHQLARTRMRSTPQEEAYAVMLSRSPYTYTTCVDSSSGRKQLQLFEGEMDDDGNLVRGRLMAVYNQTELSLL
jgi:hypothetical protein